MDSDPSETLYANGKFLNENPNPFESFDDEFGSPPLIPKRRLNSIPSGGTDTPNKNAIRGRELRRSSSACKPSSYDEMGINNGKPFLVDQVAASAPEDDCLTSVSFDSPFKDVDGCSPPARIPPVPAPRLSKQSKHSPRKPNYENHDIPRPILRTLSSTSEDVAKASWVEPQASKTHSLPQSSHVEGAGTLDHNNVDSPENLCSEIDSHGVDSDSACEPISSGASPKNAIPSLLDEANEDEEGIYTDIDEIEEQRRAQPWSKLNTLAIRDNFSRLWDEAAKELDREKEFVEEIEKLEISEPSTSHRSLAKSQHSYDSVALPGTKFILQNGVQVASTNLKLLRKFDPCFELSQHQLDDESDDEISISGIHPKDEGGENRSEDTRLTGAQGAPEPPPRYCSRVLEDDDNSSNRTSTSSSSFDPPHPPQHSPPPAYENVWIPHQSSESPRVHRDSHLSDTRSECSSLGSASVIPSPTSQELEHSPRHRPPTCTYAVPMKKKAAASSQGPDCQSLTGHQLNASDWKDSERSASTSNLAFLAKRFSFTKMTRKISDQMLKPPMPRGAGLHGGRRKTPSNTPPILRSNSAAHVHRRRGSILLEGSWPGTKPHSGPLFVGTRSKKATHLEQWCVLSNGDLSYYHLKDSMAEPKEAIPLREILSVNKRTEEGENGSMFYWLDVAFMPSCDRPQKGGGKLSLRTFGSTSAAIRDAWIDKIAPSLSMRLDNFSMHDCSKLGWVFLKVMFAGEWYRSWIALKGSFFYYTLKEEEEIIKIDLKLTKNVTLVHETRNLSTPEAAVSVVVVDFLDRSLYLQARHDKEMVHWEGVIKALAFNNGPNLSEQQMTKDGIPVIVDRCVDFVFRHGLLTEGIYRHSGVKTKIDRLLDHFQSNAWADGLVREEYSEHDVANALKRFMRTLDEPLLTEALRPMWMATTKIENEGHRLEKYEELLLGLPEVNRLTLRRLIGHLRTISNQSDKNLMSNFNVAAIWGPTLLTVDCQPASNFARTSGESDVCKDLIDHYLRLFDVTQEELEREEEIVLKTQDFNRNPMPKKITGEVMMFIHIDTKTGDDFVSTAVTPKMTAYELQQKVLRESDYSGDTTRFMLHEIIMGGLMERPVHYQEIIYDVVLKWWEWPEQVRRDSYLILKRNLVLDEALPCAIPPLSVFGDAMYSDNAKVGKAAFKKFHFSMNNAKITRSKGLKSGDTQELDSFAIEKIIWYLGCEGKKQAPSNYNITFIEKDVPVERSRESRPFYGRTISFGNRDLYIKWIAAMLVAEHQKDILPSETLLHIDDE